MLAPLLAQLADGRYAGAVAGVDQAADPEADVFVREIGAVSG